MSTCMILSIVLPILVGVYLLLPVNRELIGDNNKNSLMALHVLSLVVLVVSAGSALAAAWSMEDISVGFSVTSGIRILLSPDNLGRLYVTFISIIWILVGIYSVGYMAHEEKQRRYFAFYLMTYGCLAAQAFSGNLVTFYFFYELMTLAALPLVFHEQTHEAIMAGLKYLFYSMFGAYCALFGIYVLNHYCDLSAFVAGGTLTAATASDAASAAAAASAVTTSTAAAASAATAASAAGHTTLLLVVVFVMIIGFGVKAGMFPMHAWLPTAHPVAPAPASAVLSGIIVKAGVLGIIRVVFYVVGADFLVGTWVQSAWRILALITIFMGSLLAYREPVMKKRLAYSTVSQVSYILFGLSMLNETAVSGALMQIVFHAVIKSALFLIAGIFIFMTGKKRADEYRGIGRKMPVTLWSYTLVSLGLIGIPPTCGFIGKWYLAGGAIESGMAGYAYAAVLLVSALLTAGYLLPVMTEGFFPGKMSEEGVIKKATATTPAESLTAEIELSTAAAEAETDDEKQQKDGEPPLTMLVPVVILAALAVLLGLLPNTLTDFVAEISQSIL